METRALAIAFFYAVGTAIGGITGPLLFGKLVATEDEAPGLLRLHARRGADDRAPGSCRRCSASRRRSKNLEDVATPLSAEEAEEEEPERPMSGRPYSYSAFQSSSSRVPDEDIDEEVAALAAALRRAASSAATSWAAA